MNIVPLLLTTNTLGAGAGGWLQRFASEAAFLAIDFTEPNLSKQVFVKGGAVDGYHAADDFLTVSTGVKRVFNSAGERVATSANSLAYDYDPDTGDLRGVVCEPQGKQNLLLNNSALVTQNVTVTAQAYTIAFEGAGEIVLSGAHSATLSGTGATDRVSLTFTPSAGTLTVTPSGTVDEAQLETGNNATSPVSTAGSPVTRTNDRISLDLTKIATISGEFTIYFDWEVGDDINSDQSILTMQSSGGLSDYVRLIENGGSTFLRHRASSGSLIDTTNMTGMTKGQRHEITFRSKTAYVAASLDGGAIGLRQNTSTVVTPAAFNVLAIGSYYSSSPAIGTLRLRRIAIVPRAVENRNIADWAYERVTSTDVLDIFVLAGQSNTRNGLTLDAGLDAPGDHVFQFNHYEATKTSAVEPLNHLPSPVANAIGFGVAFGRDHAYPSTGRDVLLLPCGIDNTGFVDDRWDVGEDLYNMVESIIGVAQHKFPNATLRAILWMQGEREADYSPTSWTQEEYETAFDAMVAGWRSTFGSSLKIVVGGMVPGWVAADADRAGVAAAHVDTPNRLSNAAYADPSSPSDISSGSSAVHYSAAAQRLSSGRFWDAYETLL